jgi:hypothetical protein
MPYVELELRGPGERAVGFVEGVRAARGDRRPVWYSRRERVGHGGLIEVLKEKLGLHSHVILPVDLAAAVVDALAVAPVLGLEVAGSPEISHAELPFTFHCFTREVAAEVRRKVETELPEGVRLEGYETRETLDEEAAGVEVYSPAHAYSLEGEGCYTGPVEGVLAVAHRLEGHDFVHPGRARLVHAP